MCIFASQFERCFINHGKKLRAYGQLVEGGKTARPSRYDLNQIPYDYTVEVTNRFKGFNLIGRVPEELRMEVHDTAQEVIIKTIPKKKKCKKAKWLSEEALQ